ncbi:hypothetical protein OC835_005499 [Tilletia horrida]|nr:hypothetical protein OC835_005499 [Tilletia horrida]
MDLNIRDLVSAYLAPLAGCLPCIPSQRTRDGDDDGSPSSQQQQHQQRRTGGRGGRLDDDARVGLLSDADHINPLVGRNNHHDSAENDNSDAFSLHSNVGRNHRHRRTGSRSRLELEDSTTDGTRSEDGSSTVSSSSPRKPRRKGSATGSSTAGSSDGTPKPKSSKSKKKKQQQQQQDLASLDAEEAALAEAEEAAIRKARKKALAKARKQGLLPPPSPSAPYSEEGAYQGAPLQPPPQGWPEGTYFYDEYGNLVLMDPQHGAYYPQGYDNEDPSSLAPPPSDGPVPYLEPAPIDQTTLTPELPLSPASASAAEPSPTLKKPEDVSSPTAASAQTTNNTRAATLAGMGLTNAASRRYTRSNGSGSGSGLSGAKRYDFGSARSAAGTATAAPSSTPATAAAAAAIPPSPSAHSHLSPRSPAKSAAAAAPAAAAVVEDDDDEEIERLDEVDGLF